MTTDVADRIQALLDELDRIMDPAVLLRKGGEITAELEAMPADMRALYEDDMKRLIAALESHIFSLESRLKDPQT